MIQNKSDTSPQARSGRRKAFDPLVALDAAMETFWLKGYDGTSLDDLTAAMGINRPSLYATFGCKRELFEQALDHYGATVGGGAMRAFQAEPDIEMAVRLFLTEAALLQTRDGGAKGCFIANCAQIVGKPNPCLQARLGENGQKMLDLIESRFAAERAAGNVPNDFDPKSRASILLDFMQAQAVRARSGESRNAMLSGIDERVRLLLEA